jgi:hypothetical protein
VSRDYRLLLLGEGQEKTREVIDESGQRVEKVVRKGVLWTARDLRVGV